MTPCEADRAAQRREVDIRELDQVDRVAERSEVVDLGPVGGVVVDHDQHAQPQPGNRLEVGQAHHRAAVAERRHGESVGSRHRGADGAGQAQADGLKGLGEDEGALVGDAQVHRPDSP